MDTFKVFVERWTAPSVVISLLLIVIGGIVWGVQINSVLVKLVEQQAASHERVENTESFIMQDRVNMAKMTFVLERLVVEVKDLKAAVASHNKEAETWKRRIIINEQNQHNGE